MGFTRLGGVARARVDRGVDFAAVELARVKFASTPAGRRGFARRGALDWVGGPRKRTARAGPQSQNRPGHTIAAPRRASHPTGTARAHARTGAGGGARAITRTLPLHGEPGNHTYTFNEQRPHVEHHLDSARRCPHAACVHCCHSSGRRRVSLHSAHNPVMEPPSTAGCVSGGATVKRGTNRTTHTQKKRQGRGCEGEGPALRAGVGDGHGDGRAAHGANSSTARPRPVPVHSGSQLTHPQALQRSYSPFFSGLATPLHAVQNMVLSPHPTHKAVCRFPPGRGTKISPGFFLHVSHLPYLLATGFFGPAACFFFAAVAGSGLVPLSAGRASRFWTGSAFAASCVSDRGACRRGRAGKRTQVRSGRGRCTAAGYYVRGGVPKHGLQSKAVRALATESPRAPSSQKARHFMFHT